MNETLPYPGYVFKAYPKHGKDPLGNKCIFQSAAHESAVTGIPMNEDGTPVDSDDPPPGDARPPTLIEVMKAGYAPDVAALMVAEEERKHLAGEKPYGDKEVTFPPDPEPVAPVPVVEVVAEPVPSQIPLSAATAPAVVPAKKPAIKVDK